MNQLELKALAKINLGLDVLGKRENGYHDVRMIMQSIYLYDTIRIEKTGADEGISLCSNLSYLPSDGNNIAYKAAQLLKEEFGIREGLSIRLDKRIPVAAGMAGGSTDAAAALTAVNRMFDLGLTEEQLKERAVKIGADVPYCLQGGTALSEGIGEILTALPPAPACHVVVAKPPIRVSTKWVYQNLHLEQVTEHPDIDGMTESIRQGDYAGVVRRLSNVLESVTVPRYPVIAQIRDFLRENGADGALMSGSGPTVFALFDDRQRARQALDALQKTGLAAQTFLTALTERTCVEQD